MKKEMFFFPFNIILNKLGAIPLDRKNKKINYVSQVALIFNKKEEFNLFIAPEGTRKKVSRWKKAFSTLLRKQKCL